VALTSPDGMDNHISKWAEAVDKYGKLVWHVIHVELLCKACKKLPPEQGMHCKHIKNSAHWIDTRKSDKIKALYADDPALAMQEFGGAIVSTYIRAFMREEVTRLFNKPLYFEILEPKMIITAADNSGAGSSHLALTSGYFTPDGQFVVSVFLLFLTQKVIQIV